MRINLVRICFTIILAEVVLFGSVQAAGPLQVTVTATPSTLSSGHLVKNRIDMNTYPQPPEVVEACEPDNVVLQSTGAVMKLLQTACLYASGVRAPL